jgi:ATP-dependent DNA ligase
LRGSPDESTGDVTLSFPELHDLRQRVAATDVVLDDEIVADDAEGDLRWVGQVGSGLSADVIERLLRERKPLVHGVPALPELQSVSGANFVHPRLRVPVEYLEGTRSSVKLRPVFKGLCRDAPPSA